LGIIKPKDILDCSLEYRPPSERADWERPEQARAAQHNLFGETIKPLDFPEAKFMTDCSSGASVERRRRIQREARETLLENAADIVFPDVDRKSTRLNYSHTVI